MPETQEPSSVAAPAALGDNKGIRFSIKTGGKSYECTLQDRSAYERQKGTRTNSTDSVDSAASSKADKSA